MVNNMKSIYDGINEEIYSLQLSKEEKAFFCLCKNSFSSLHSLEVSVAPHSCFSVNLETIMSRERRFWPVRPVRVHNFSPGISVLPGHVDW